MPQALTYPLIALATILWGANFNLAGQVLADFDAFSAAALRFILAAAAMIVLALLRGERLPLLRHAWAYGLLGLVGVGAFNTLFFLGMRSTSAVNGALIMATSPMLTTVLAVLVSGTRLGLRQILALPIALAGVAFVVLGGGGMGGGAAASRGDVLLGCAAIAWAAYNVLVPRILPREVSSLANTAGVMTAGALVLSIEAMFAGSIPTPHMGSAMALLIMAIGGSVLAYLFWNAGLAQIGAARAAVFMNLVPVSSMAFAALEGHAPTAAQVGGGAVVIGALLLAAWPRGAGLPTPAVLPVAQRRGATRTCDA